MCVDETCWRADGKMKLAVTGGHEHRVTRPDAGLGYPAEVNVQLFTNSGQMIAAQLIIATHSVRRDPERHENHAYAIEPFFAAALWAKASSDQRLRARCIIDPHLNYAPG